LLYLSLSSSASVFVNDLHLLHPLSASEHTIILGDFNVNRNTTPSLYEKVVQHFKTNDLQQCVTNPTTIYGSTLDLVFTGGHLPSIIYNGCYYSDHMTLLIQKKIQWLLKGNFFYRYPYASVVDSWSYQNLFRQYCFLE
jgi:endonuclease/exonuclease/phosphatase family metal-dependent hydrolase